MVAPGLISALESVNDPAANRQPAQRNDNSKRRSNGASFGGFGRKP
jgi:hypothetical protein